jgi:hypothetical protein
MKHAFVLVEKDIDSLKQSSIYSLDSESVICLAISEIEQLLNAENIHFIISKYSMCSTAFQLLVDSVINSVEEAKFWILRIDDTPIPIGFQILWPLQQWEVHQSMNGSSDYQAS